MGKEWGRQRKGKTHIEDVRFILDGIVKSRHDVGEISRSIRRKSLKREDLGLRRDQVDEPGSHRAVAKRDIRRTVQNRGRGLIEYRRAGLLHHHRLGSLRSGGAYAGGGKIEPFGSA